VFEASERPGGQVLLAARSSRRKEMIGVIDWRVAQLEEHGVAIRTATYAGADEVLQEEPDIVFIATGGLPNTAILDAGEELVVSTWEVASGRMAAADRVLVYDDNGNHPAMQAAEMLAERGAAVEIVTPERMFAPEIGGLNHAAYARVFQRYGVRVTINTRLRAVRRDGNALVAVLGSDYGLGLTERRVDRVVVEHGTLPVDDVYHLLKPHSLNLGEVDYRALLTGRRQLVVRHQEGRFRLFRIGDAVASRNIHAAVYDALRLAKDI
jgi:NADPH-dependent 2,4-dienoyl-CoA reductase/sulfur reductase-like enzyme